MGKNDWLDLRGIETPGRIDRIGTVDRIQDAGQEDGHGKTKITYSNGETFTVSVGLAEIAELVGFAKPKISTGGVGDRGIGSKR